MMYPNAFPGHLLTWLLTVLLTVPLAVSVHHREADHDGGVAHLEVPHGGHDSPTADLYDRVTSTRPESAAAHLQSNQPAFDDGFVVGVVGFSPGHSDHPARPPPAPHRSRAPPFGL